MEELIITKRKLPHYFLPEKTYFITFRLKGTYPIDYKTHNLAAYLAFDEKRDILTNKSNLLSEDGPAKIVCDSLKFYDNKEYNLLCFCI